MKINKEFYQDTLGWGFLLWLFGFIIGMILFLSPYKSMIGYVLPPVMAVAALFVLLKKIKSFSFAYYTPIAISWTILAIALDYFVIVKTFNPADGYYNADIYLYYGLMFILPLIVGWLKENKAKENQNR